MIWRHNPVEEPKPLTLYEAARALRLALEEKGIKASEVEVRLLTWDAGYQLADDLYTELKLSVIMDKKHSVTYNNIRFTWPAKDDIQPQPKPEWKPCQNCGQTGKVYKLASDVHADCPDCDGKGWTI